MGKESVESTQEIAVTETPVICGVTHSSSVQFYDSPNVYGEFLKHNLIKTRTFLHPIWLRLDKR